MSDTSSVPELLGFQAVPYDRKEAYSPASYRALYCLTEEEAKDITNRHSSHGEIDLQLAQRYMSDLAYRMRVDDARADITAAEPSEDVVRIMQRLKKTMKKTGATA